MKERQTLSSNHSKYRFLRHEAEFHRRPAPFDRKYQQRIFALFREACQTL